MRSHTLLPLLLVACGTSPAPESSTASPGASAALTILHSSRLDGEIEPCG